MQDFIANHWGTVLFALAALAVWTIGNMIKKKLFVYIGIALCVLALLSYAGVFRLLFSL